MSEESEDWQEWLGTPEAIRTFYIHALNYRDLRNFDRSKRGDIFMEKNGFMSPEIYYELLNKKSNGDYVLGQLTSRDGDLEEDTEKKIVNLNTLMKMKRMKRMNREPIQGQVRVLPTPTFGGKKRKSRKQKKSLKRKSSKARKSHKKRR